MFIPMPCTSLLIRFSNARVSFWKIQLILRKVVANLLVLGQITLRYLSHAQAFLKNIVENLNIIRYRHLAIFSPEQYKPFLSLN